MRAIPDIAWLLLWSFPLRIFGAIFQEVQFIYWSGAFEFKQGTIWALNRYQKKHKQPSDGKPGD